MLIILGYYTTAFLVVFVVTTLLLAATFVGANLAVELWRAIDFRLSMKFFSDLALFNYILLFSLDWSTK